MAKVHGIAVPMVNHSGQTCLVPVGDDTWAATVSGPDGWSAFRDRPGLVRLAWSEQNKTWIRVRGTDFTEMGTFEKNQPIQVKMGADPEMLQAPDGYYYFIASAIKPGKLLMYRSKSLDPAAPWEEIEVSNGQAIVDETRWPVEALGAGQKSEDPAKVNFWEGSHMWYRNRLYIGAGLLSLAAPGGRKTGIGLWRSREGTGAPPYEFVGRIASMDGFSFFNDDEKAAYICSGFGGLRRFKDDMSGLDPAFKPIDLAWRDRSQINYDCGYHLVKIGTTYVKMVINNLGSYSSAYGTADRIEGPYDFQGVCMPHGGNSPLFKDLAGNWWMQGWGNTDVFLPYWDATPVWMEPMTVERRDGRLVIEPQYRTEARK